MKVFNIKYLTIFISILHLFGAAKAETKSPASKSFVDSGCVREVNGESLPLQLKGRTLTCRANGPVLWLRSSVEADTMEDRRHFFPSAELATAAINQLYFKDGWNDPAHFELLLDKMKEFLIAKEKGLGLVRIYGSGYRPTSKADLQIDTFIPNELWIARPGPNGRYVREMFVDPENYRVEQSDGSITRESASNYNNYILAAVDLRNAPLEFSRPAPYNLDFPTDEKGRLVAPNGAPFGTKISIPGVSRCQKAGFLQLRGSRGLVPAREQTVVCYRDTLGINLPDGMNSPISRNDDVTIVLGVAYLGADRKGRQEPEIVAEWQASIKDLSRASYVILTSGDEYHPGVIIGLKPALGPR